MKIILLILTFSILILPQITIGQYSGADSIQLVDALNKLFKKYKTPDAALAITRNDSIIFQLTKKPENQNKNYYIGGCSKSFTALALLQLADAGKVELDIPIKKYLPWFELKDTNKSNLITIRHLLNQTTGFKTINGFFEYITRDQSLYEKKLAEYVKTLDLKSAPGEAFNGSNLNYTLAGLIVAHASNESYASYLKKNIFSKIGMSYTYASYSESQSSNLIPGYQYWFTTLKLPAKFIHSDFFIPQGFISSNITDLSAYLNCIRKGCITKSGDTLLSARNYNAFITPLKEEYAMGWMGNKLALNNVLYHEYEFPFIYHPGINENYNSIFAISSDRNICIVVLSNINSRECAKEAMNILLSNIINKPYKSGISIEIIERNLLMLVQILLALGLCYNIYRWKKYGFRFGTSTRSFAVIRLFVGITLSVVPMFVLPIMNNISLSSLLTYMPDFGFGLIFSGSLGFLSSLVRYESTYSKYFQKIM